MVKADGAGNFIQCFEDCPLEAGDAEQLEVRHGRLVPRQHFQSERPADEVERARRDTEFRLAEQLARSHDWVCIEGEPVQQGPGPLAVTVNPQPPPPQDCVLPISREFERRQATDVQRLVEQVHER